jgi:hypothetical protein
MHYREAVESWAAWPRRQCQILAVMIVDRKVKTLLALVGGSIVYGSLELLQQKITIFVWISIIEKPNESNSIDQKLSRVNLLIERILRMSLGTWRILFKTKEYLEGVWRKIWPEMKTSMEVSLSTVTYCGVGRARVEDRVPCVSTHRSWWPKHHWWWGCSGQHPALSCPTIGSWSCQLLRPSGIVAWPWWWGRVVGEGRGYQC